MSNFAIDMEATVNSDTSGIWNKSNDSAIINSHDDGFCECAVIPTQGFALIVKAKHNGRWWMLKGIKKEYADKPLYQELLRKEYAILNQMQHPNIVQVFGMQEVDPYGTCIIMEYVDGVSLSVYLQRKISYSSKVRIVGNLLDSLEYIHSKQIVHRDLKPDNIIVTHNGKNLKVIDFGLADTDTHYLLKQPAGTARYMSPEQKETNSADIRNDIYSLGVVIDELHLRWYFYPFIRKCKQSIDCRYKNVNALRKAFERYQKVPLLCISCIVVIYLTCTFAWFLNKENVSNISIEKLQRSQKELIAFHYKDSMTILELKDSISRSSLREAERNRMEKLKAQQEVEYQELKESILSKGKLMIDSECRKLDVRTFNSESDIGVAIDHIIDSINQYVESINKRLTPVDCIELKNNLSLYSSDIISNSVDKWKKNIRH